MKKTDLDFLIETVCNEFGVTRTEVTENSSSKRKYAHPREALAYFLTSFGLNQSEVAAIVNRNRSSIYYAVNTFNWWVANDNDVQQHFEAINQKLVEHFTPTGEISDRQIRKFLNDFIRYLSTHDKDKEPCDIVKICYLREILKHYSE